MESPCPQLLMLADAPGAVVELFGISMLERLLRVAQRLGYREALIVSKIPAEIAAHLAKPSWARAEISLTFRTRAAGPVHLHELVTGNERTLLVSAGFFFCRPPFETVGWANNPDCLVGSAAPAARRSPL